MSPAQHILWGENPAFRTVNTLHQLIQNRWRLQVIYLDQDGQVQSLAEVEAASPEACEALAAGGMAHRCDADRVALLLRLKKEQSPAAGSQVHTCYAGLREVVAPVMIQGQVHGCVVAGGFLDQGDSPAKLNKQLDQAGLPHQVLQPTLEQVPRLGAAEQDFLQEVVALLAAEISSIQHDAVAADQRGQAQRQQPTKYSYSNIIGTSQPMQTLYRLLDKVIDSDSTVMIQGENGTGKELIAKAIHYNSTRQERRFVVQNCSAFNDNLLDSELFGHKKGAFTGAISDKQGLFEVADGSTFFLDEIGDMTAALQVKLLRVLQEGTFIPVGGTQSKQVDVRIIAATNRDLKAMVESAEFREDLYYRINVINIVIPPLRDRKEDIPLLVDHFLTRHAGGDRQQLKKLSRGCQARLLEHAWPGNIRELENEIERLVVLAGEERLVGQQMLSSRIAQPHDRQETDTAHNPNCLPDAIHNLERTMIFDVLKRNNWNKTRAAQELQISRRNLIRKVHKYQLEP